VMMLRRIEYHPSSAPHTLAAIRSLERARQRNAEKMLSESRTMIEADKRAVRIEVPLPQPKETHEEMSFAPSLPLSEITAPPPISKVLHDVYQEDTRAS